ncbi:MAG TPA: CheR family methyltransferase, partial [Thermoanaerobaculia bacterium]
MRGAGAETTGTPPAATAARRPKRRRARARRDAPVAAAAPRLIVGVGASAGGLEACQRLLRGAPADAGLAFVIVLHLAPSEESHVSDILQRDTGMTVRQVAGGERVEAEHVYVIAPGTSLGIGAGALVVGPPAEPHYRARPIDTFFAALAADRGASAAGIVLSGTGEDGSAGLEAIRAAGGLCLAQDPATAAFADMPQSAIDTGAVERVVPPEEMGEILGTFAATPAAEPDRARPPKTPAPKTPPPKPPSDASPSQRLENILELLGTRYGVDFRDYKRGTMERRTERRIRLHRLAGWEAYREFLDTHPEEVEALYGDLLIGVTEFFRDPEEWELLAREIVPELVAGRGDAATVRAWSAGCATGEEAYGLAMVLLEHLETVDGRVEAKVFASDASPGALEIGRRGRYPADIAEQVSAERLERFFRPAGDGYEVVSELRAAVTFASHDLLSDPPFPHLDLVSCRNVLIYLEPAAQERLLERFHFALRPGGMLWLGAAETVGRRTDLFTQVSGAHRIYRATEASRLHPLAARRARAPAAAPAEAPTEAAASAPVAPVSRLIEKLVLQRHTAPCVVVGPGLEILSFFGPTDAYLTRPQGEVRMDLLSWVRPELYAKLRAGLAEASARRRPVTLTGMLLEGPDEARRVEITIEPIAPGRREGGML